jgi:hypothetical protein
MAACFKKINRFIPPLQKNREGIVERFRFMDIAAMTEERTKGSGSPLSFLTRLRIMG